MPIVKWKWPGNTQYRKRGGFTLIELLLGMMLFSIGLIAIIEVINYGLTFVERSRQDIIAVNLAREWVESLHIVRGTNWLYHSSQKDECWLKEDPFTESGDPWCQDDTWIQSGVYIPVQTSINGQSYFLLSGGSLPLLDIKQTVWPEDRASRVCFDNDQWQRNACPDDQTHIDPEGYFFRQIHVKWLYRKDVATLWWDPLLCDHGSDQSGDCGDERAKELRYCVLVQYQKDVFGEVELCSMITNFEE